LSFKYVSFSVSTTGVETLVVAVKPLLVEDIARHEVERYEIRNQAIGQPCIRVPRLCPDQQETLLGRHFLDLDLAELRKFPLGGIQERESAFAIDQLCIGVNPRLQPDAVELRQIPRRIGLVDQHAHGHLGAVLEIAGLIDPGCARQLDPTAFEQEIEHPFSIQHRQVADLPRPRPAEPRR
jgi:hypothetical protein